jgi:hypothetical protein
VIGVWLAMRHLRAYGWGRTFRTDYNQWDADMRDSAIGLSLFAFSLAFLVLTIWGFAEGAFVAVSDDATTTWWNPAGLAGGGYFNSVIEIDRLEHPSDTRASALALNVPSLGLSYYRLALNGMRLVDTTGSPSANREDQGVLSQFGVTVGQSLGAHVILGSTLKVMNALGEFSGDLDMGAMATFSRFRLGLAARNLRTRSSRTATRPRTPRQVRVVPPLEAVRQPARSSERR